MFNAKIKIDKNKVFCIFLTSKQTPGFPKTLIWPLQCGRTYVRPTRPTLKQRGRDEKQKRMNDNVHASPQIPSGTSAPLPRSRVALRRYTMHDLNQHMTQPMCSGPLLTTSPVRRKAMVCSTMISVASHSSTVKRVTNAGVCDVITSRIRRKLADTCFVK